MARDHAVACRRLYGFYKAAGICVKCGQNWSEPGHVACANCARKEAARQRRADPDGAKRRERNRRLRDARRAAGLCVQCGRPAEAGRARCARCLSRGAQSTAVYKIRRHIKQSIKQE